MNQPQPPRTQAPPVAAGGRSAAPAGATQPGGPAVGPSQRRRDLADLSLVACGAVPGALLRWQFEQRALLQELGISAGLDRHLAANLLGCLLIGLLLAQPPQRARLLLWGGVGLCGSLTTFSGWLLEVVISLTGGRWFQALAQLIVPLTLGLALVALGQALGRRILAGSAR